MPVRRCCRWNLGKPYLETIIIWFSQAIQVADVHLDILLLSVSDCFNTMETSLAATSSLLANLQALPLCLKHSAYVPFTERRL